LRVFAFKYLRRSNLKLVWASRWDLSPTRSEFRAASGPETKPKEESERNTSQTKSREKLDHQIEDKSRKDKRIEFKKISFRRRIFLFKRLEENDMQI